VHTETVKERNKNMKTQMKISVGKNVSIGLVGYMLETAKEIIN